MRARTGQRSRRALVGEERRAFLRASVPAGIEAPLRLYVTENADGTASITYRTPTATFAPYGNGKLDALAGEFDPILARIVADAVGK